MSPVFVFFDKSLSQSQSQMISASRRSYRAPAGHFKETHLPG